MRRLHFAVQRNGQPIQYHGVRHGVNPNITFGRLLPNLVPQYEELEACVYVNYNYSQWRELTWQEKACAVAHYRMHRLVELHGSDAVNTKMEQDQKRHSSKIRRR